MKTFNIEVQLDNGQMFSVIDKTEESITTQEEAARLVEGKENMIVPYIDCSLVIKMRHVVWMTVKEAET